MKPHPNRAVNDNPDFARYASPDGPPEGWVEWVNGWAASRTRGRSSEHAVRLAGPAGENAGIQAVVGRRRGGRYVLHATITLTVGSLRAAGLLVEFTREGAPPVTATVVFSNESGPDGEPLGDGRVGSTYEFCKDLEIGAPGHDGSVTLFAMSHWDALGPYTNANEVVFHEVALEQLQ